MTSIIVKRENLDTDEHTEKRPWKTAEEDNDLPAKERPRNETNATDPLISDF